MTDNQEVEQDDLESFFEGEEHPITTEPEKEPEQDEPAKVEAEPEPEQETEQEPETASETTSDEKPTLVPIAALHDERRKAQQAREEAEMLRKQVPVQDEAPDPYEDIDKYNAYMRQQWEREQFAKQDQQRRQNLDQSRSKMLETHQDYEEKERVFELMATRDPSLVDKMFMSGNEAKFAYDMATSYINSVLPKGKAETIETAETAPIAEVPNLAKATAQAKNTPQVEPEATIDDIFADMEY